MGMNQLHEANIDDVDSKTLFVLDTTAKPPHPQRTHTLIIGEQQGEQITKDFTFKSGVRLEMPFTHAVKFLPIPSFIISEDEDGERIYDPTPQTSEDGTAIKLDADQVVANLNELTQEAVMIRCNQIPGGEHFKKNTKKNAMIDFLVNHAGVDRFAGPEDLDDGEDDGHNVTGGDMSPAELESLMED